MQGNTVHTVGQQARLSGHRTHHPSSADNSPSYSSSSGPQQPAYTEIAGMSTQAAIGIESVTVAGYRGEVQLTYQPGKDVFTVSVLHRCVPLTTIVTSLRQGIAFEQPLNGRAQRHYLCLRGTFVDLPEASWLTLRDWYSARATAAWQRRRQLTAATGPDIAPSPATIQET
ncbi:hypothetical protein [Xanthomonas oryzae]|uniref:hypothetical protein n=1 Tax=Xanthomonas oryzae TaxID=347 RepID=UPI001F5EEBB6|nr:hypothetical protein [Xanthomonas oryzae]